MLASSRSRFLIGLRAPVITAAAVSAIFASGLMSALLGALLPTYALTPEQQGSVALSNAVGLVIASVCAGLLVDAKGKKPVLLLGLLLIVIGLASAPSVATYRPLMATYFTLGMGAGIVTTGANSLIASEATERKSAALNFANLFFGLAGIITTFAASYLFSPAALCYSIAAVSIFALFIVLIAPIPKALVVVRFDSGVVFALLTDRVLQTLSLLLFLYVACEVGVWNWLKLYLISIHFTPQSAGGTVSYGFALGILLGRLGASKLLFGRSSTTVLIIASMALAVTTFSMLHVFSRLAVTIVVLCAGLAMAPVFPTTLSLVSDHFQTSSASAIGIAVTSGWLGLALSSPLIGYFAGRDTLQHALLVLPLMASAMVLVSLVLQRQLPKGKQT